MSKIYAYKNRVLIFLLLFFCGIGFGVWSMFIPPEGAISPSVLVFIAQIFVLAAGVYGMEVNFDIKEGQFKAGQKSDSAENPES
jgi:hypothetical protein